MWRVGAEVLQDHGEHDARPVGVRDADQARDLARAPDGRPRVGGEGAVVLDVEPEEGNRAEQREIPARIANGRFAQAAGEREAENLTVGSSCQPPRNAPPGLPRPTGTP